MPGAGVFGGFAGLVGCGVAVGAGEEEPPRDPEEAALPDLLPDLLPDPLAGASLTGAALSRALPASQAAQSMFQSVQPLPEINGRPVSVMTTTSPRRENV